MRFSGLESLREIFGPNFVEGLKAMFEIVGRTLVYYFLSPLKEFYLSLSFDGLPNLWLALRTEA